MPEEIVPMNGTFIIGTREYAGGYPLCNTTNWRSLPDPLTYDGPGLTIDDEGRTQVVLAKNLAGGDPFICNCESYSWRRRRTGRCGYGSSVGGYSFQLKGRNCDKTTTDFVDSCYEGTYPDNRQPAPSYWHLPNRNADCLFIPNFDPSSYGYKRWGRGGSLGVTHANEPYIPWWDDDDDDGSISGCYEIAVTTCRRDYRCSWIRETVVGERTYYGLYIDRYMMYDRLHKFPGRSFEKFTETDLEPTVFLPPFPPTVNIYPHFFPALNELYPLTDFLESRPGEFIPNPATLWTPTSLPATLPKANGKKLIFWDHNHNPYHLYPDFPDYFSFEGNYSFISFDGIDIPLPGTVVGLAPGSTHLWTSHYTYGNDCQTIQSTHPFDELIEFHPIAHLINHPPPDPLNPLNESNYGEEYISGTSFREGTDLIIEEHLVGDWIFIVNDPDNLFKYRQHIFNLIYVPTGEPAGSQIVNEFYKKNTNFYQYSTIEWKNVDCEEEEMGCCDAVLSALASLSSQVNALASDVSAMKTELVNVHFPTTSWTVPTCGLGDPELGTTNYIPGSLPGLQNTFNNIALATEHLGNTIAHNKSVLCDVHLGDEGQRLLDKINYQVNVSIPNKLTNEFADLDNYHLELTSLIEGLDFGVPPELLEKVNEIHNDIVNPFGWYKYAYPLAEVAADHVERNNIKNDIINALNECCNNITERLNADISTEYSTFNCVEVVGGDSTDFGTFTIPFTASNLREALNALIAGNYYNNQGIVQLAEMVCELKGQFQVDIPTTEFKEYNCWDGGSGTAIINVTASNLKEAFKAIITANNYNNRGIVTLNKRLCDVEEAVKLEVPGLEFYQFSGCSLTTPGEAEKTPLGLWPMTSMQSAVNGLYYAAKINNDSLVKLAEIVCKIEEKLKLEVPGLDFYQFSGCSLTTPGEAEKTPLGLWPMTSMQSAVNGLYYAAKINNESLIKLAEEICLYFYGHYPMPTISWPVSPCGETGGAVFSIETGTGNLKDLIATSIYAAEKVGLSVGLVGQQHCQTFDLLKSTNNPPLDWSIPGCDGSSTIYWTADNPDGIDNSINSLIYGIQALGRSLGTATQKICDRLESIEVDLTPVTEAIDAIEIPECPEIPETDLTPVLDTINNRFDNDIKGISTVEQTWQITDCCEGDVVVIDYAIGGPGLPGSNGLRNALRETLEGIKKLGRSVETMNKNLCCFFEGSFDDIELKVVDFEALETECVTEGEADETTAELGILPQSYSDLATISEGVILDPIAAERVGVRGIRDVLEFLVTGLFELQRQVAYLRCDFPHVEQTITVPNLSCEETEETEPLSFNGYGQGLLVNLFRTTLKQQQELHERVCQIEPCCVVALPGDQYGESLVPNQLALTFVPYNPGEPTTSQYPKLSPVHWTVNVPHPMTEGLNWDEHFEPLIWRRGRVHARIYFETNKMWCGGFFESEEFAIEFVPKLAAFSTLPLKYEGQPRITKYGAPKRKPVEQVAKCAQATLIFMNPETREVQEIKCFRPPLE